MATRNIAYGSNTTLTTTNLQSLANSATAGWQSVKIDNQASVKAIDYEIFVKLTTAAGSPANDKCAYVYVCPFYTTDGGTTWYAADQGTATLPTGAEGTTTIIASGGNLKPLGILSHNTSGATLQQTFNLSNAVGQSMPHGFSIIIINYTGVALSTSCIVAYTTITETIA